MKILIIAAHPDDETLGAGATASALAQQGAQVRIHILAEGISLRHSGMTSEQARERCQAAANELSVAELSFGGLAADGRLLAELPQRQVVDTVNSVLSRDTPEIILTHHPGDIHADHRSVAQAVEYGTRVLGAGSIRQVLHFEVLSSTEQQTGLATSFIPNLFYDVTGHIEAKCRALAAYPYEVYDPPHPRSLTSVRTLAAYRGTQVGTEAAEAFVTGRELRTPRTANPSGGYTR